jgi:AraC-like DNA-binding protein
MELKINCTQDGVVRYPMHEHKNYEIMIYLEGNGYMRTELGDYKFERGSVIIVPPEVKHGSVSEKGFKNISIEGSFEGYFCFDRIKCFSDNEAREGEALARMIYENRFEDGAYLSALCTAYICFLMKCFSVENLMQRRIEEIAFEINRSATDPEIDLTSILSKSGYSEDYIRSCFKSITGKTPHGLLTDIRIKHACYLIDIYKNELSLSEIAERCGYLDYIYFSKKFKQVTGLSPRRYRND